MKKTRKVLSIGLFVVLTFLLISPVLAAPTWERNPKGFVHGIALDLGDGTDWYFAGPGSMMGKKDVPGHTWVQTGKYRVKGRHYNVGPPPAAGMPWWATQEPYGVLLFIVDGIIAPWTMETAEKMAARGYVHYHELVDGSDSHHPTLVVWLKHTAVRSFNFDGGPMPGAAHEVTPGVDYNFMPNWWIPYIP